MKFRVVRLDKKYFAQVLMVYNDRPHWYTLTKGFQGIISPAVFPGLGYDTVTECDQIIDAFWEKNKSRYDYEVVKEREYPI